MKRLGTAVLDETKRGGFFKKSEVPKDDNSDEDTKMKKEDDVRLVSLSSKGF
jgi:hypothetical protein